MEGSAAIVVAAVKVEQTAQVESEEQILVEDSSSADLEVVSTWVCYRYTSMEFSQVSDYD